MTLVIPPDASVNVQAAFREIERRLAAVEKKPDTPPGMATQDDLVAIRKQLRAAMIEPNFTTWEDVFGSPTAVARVGINLKAVGVPAGAAAAATITTPASGTNNLPGLIPFGITDTEALNKFNLLGSLFVQGGLLSSKVTTGRLEVPGAQPGFLLYQDQVAVHATGANTTETDLSKTLLQANTLATNGDFLKIKFKYVAAANGNTKTLRLYIGTTASILLSAATNGIIYWIEIILQRTSATGQTLQVGYFPNTGSNSFASLSPTETLSNDLDIKLTGQNGTASATDIQTTMFWVEVWRQ